jgi:putative transposase
MVMPNHFHGIIIIEKSAVKAPSVETRHALSLKTQQQRQPHFRFQNQGGNTISSMIGSYKSAVTRLAKPINNDFCWQGRFYDHIIRSHDEFLRISAYIINNPKNWKDNNA